MPNPPPSKRPDSFFSKKAVWLLVFWPAVILMLLPATRVVALSPMTLLALTLMSCPLEMATVLPLTVLPS